MTIDMHLTFPIGTVEYVRKVCYDRGRNSNTLQQGTVFIILATQEQTLFLNFETDVPYICVTSNYSTLTN